MGTKKADDMSNWFRTHFQIAADHAAPTFGESRPAGECGNFRRRKWVYRLHFDEFAPGVPGRKRMNGSRSVGVSFLRREPAGLNIRSIEATRVFGGDPPPADISHGIRVGGLDGTVICFGISTHPKAIWIQRGVREYLTE